jgi:hypothetical protein
MDPQARSIIAAMFPEWKAVLVVVDLLNRSDGEITEVDADSLLCDYIC